MTQIEWKPNGNSRTFASTAGGPCTLGLLTPATVGSQRMLQGGPMPGSQYLNRQWTLRDAAGKTIVSVNGQTPPITVIVGADVPGPRGTISAYGLAPNTQHTLTVEDKNPDGSSSVSGSAPLEFYEDCNNMGSAG